MSNNQLTLMNSALPAYLQTSMSPEQVAAMNGAAATGTGGGAAVNKIGIKAARFRIQPVGGAEMVLNDYYLDVVVVRANEGISKVYYTKEWQENQEAEAPDCSSDDGITPRLDSPNIQNHDCASCPQNQWGSKINKHNGKKVKACTDNKRLALQPPGPDGRYATKSDLYQLGVPPASLSGFGELIGKLNAMPQKVPYNAVVARMTFDTTANFPKLKFDAVRFLDNEEYANINGRYNDPDTKIVAGLAEAQVMRAPSNQAPLGTVQLGHQQQQAPHAVQQQAPVQQPAPQANPWPAQQPVQQAPAQQAPQANPWPAQAAPAQQPAPQQAPASNPWPAQAAPVQQPVAQQPAANPWPAQQAPAEQPTQQAPAQQTAPVQQTPAGDAPQMIQGLGLAFPDGQGGWRAVGKSSGGRARRTKVEIAQDEAWTNSQGGQQAPATQQAPVQQAPVAEVAQQPAQQAPVAWGNPAPEQAPVQPTPAAWGAPAPEQAPVQASAWPGQPPATHTQSLPPADNPFGGQGQPAPQGAPNQPGVVADPVGAFGGWDDPAPQQ